MVALGPWAQGVPLRSHAADTKVLRTPLPAPQRAFSKLAARLKRVLVVSEPGDGPIPRRQPTPASATPSPSRICKGLTLPGSVRNSVDARLNEDGIPGLYPLQSDFETPEELLQVSGHQPLSSRTHSRMGLKHDRYARYVQADTESGSGTTEGPPTPSTPGFGSSMARTPSTPNRTASPSAVSGRQLRAKLAGLADDGHGGNSAIENASSDNVNATSEFLNNMSQQEIRDIFNLFDADGSGNIDSEELEVAMGALGVQATKADIQKMMSDADSDGSGTVDYDEFLNMVLQQAQNLGPKDENAKAVQRRTVHDAPELLADATDDPPSPTDVTEDPLSPTAVAGEALGLQLNLSDALVSPPVSLPARGHASPRGPTGSGRATPPESPHASQHDTPSVSAQADDGEADDAEGLEVGEHPGADNVVETGEAETAVAEVVVEAETVTGDEEKADSASDVDVDDLLTSMHRSISKEQKRGTTNARGRQTVKRKTKGSRVSTRCSALPTRHPGGPVHYFNSVEEEAAASDEPATGAQSPSVASNAAVGVEASQESTEASQKKNKSQSRRRLVTNRTTVSATASVGAAAAVARAGMLEAVNEARAARSRASDIQVKIYQRTAEHPPALPGWPCRPCSDAMLPRPLGSGMDRAASPQAGTARLPPSLRAQEQTAPSRRVAVPLGARRAAEAAKARQLPPECEAGDSADDIRNTGWLEMKLQVTPDRADTPAPTSHAASAPRVLAGSVLRNRYDLERSTGAQRSLRTRKPDLDPKVPMMLGRRNCVIEMPGKSSRYAARAEAGERVLKHSETMLKRMLKRLKGKATPEPGDDAVHGRCGTSPMVTLWSWAAGYEERPHRPSATSMASPDSPTSPLGHEEWSINSDDDLVVCAREDVFRCEDEDIDVYEMRFAEHADESTVGAEVTF